MKKYLKKLLLFLPLSFISTSSIALTPAEEAIYSEYAQQQLAASPAIERLRAFEIAHADEAARVPKDALSREMYDGFNSILECVREKLGFTVRVATEAFSAFRFATPSTTGAASVGLRFHYQKFMGVSSKEGKSLWKVHIEGASKASAAMFSETQRKLTEKTRTLFGIFNALKHEISVLSALPREKTPEEVIELLHNKNARAPLFYDEQLVAGTLFVPVSRFHLFPPQKSTGDAASGGGEGGGGTSDA